MTEEEIKRIAKEFADQSMNQRSEDHDEDTDAKSISPVEPGPKNETNETDTDRAGD